MTRTLFALAAVSLAAVPLLAGNWTQFRGPHGNGVSDESNAPAALDSASNIAWTADLPGRGLSSPIVIGDRVIVTCASGPHQDRLHVFCFNAADGTKRWERQFWATGRTMTQQKTCVAAPTPASDGRRVFALFSSNDLICLDLDGNLLWLRGLTHDYPNASNSLGLASSPTCASDTLVVLIENEGDPFAAGIDTATGVNRWKQPRHKITCWTSPVVFSDKAGRQVVALQSKNGITAVLPATGEVAWRFETEASQIPSCAAANGILYVPSRGLVALQPDAAGGPPKELWRTSQLAVATPSPVPLGDRVFTVNGAGVLTCGEAATGKRLWQLRLKGPFSSTPVAAGGRMYLVNEKGLVQVVDITQSQGALISELDLAQTVLCTPAIANGAIYVRSDGRLWKLAKP